MLRSLDGKEMLSAASPIRTGIAVRTEMPDSEMHPENQGTLSSILMAQIRSSRGSAREVRAEEIADYLSIYHPDWILMMKGELLGGTISGTFCSVSYPFTHDPIFPYIPAAIQVLYFAQLGYVLIGTLAAGGLLLPLGVDLPKYRALRDGARILYRHTSLIFRREIPIGADCVASLEISKIRIQSHVIYTSLNASIPGYTGGTVSAAILLG